MADAGSSSRVAKVDAGNGVAKKDVAGRVVEPLAPVSASSSGIAMLAQAKLSVGRVDDPAELDADQMAQKFSQWNGAGGSVEVSEGSSGGDAMRSADTGTLETGGFEVGADVQSEISSRSGRGVPLADDQRSKFEQFFGKDLSDVRVHADNDASQLSGSLGAEAFTVGNDVYFGSGRYQSGASDKLLAHELTHVVQQNSTINRWPKWLDKLRGKNQPQVAGAPPNEWDASQYQVAGPTNRGAGEADYEEPVVRPQENEYEVVNDDENPYEVVNDDENQWDTSQHQAADSRHPTSEGRGLYIDPREVRPQENTYSGLQAGNQTYEVARPTRPPPLPAFEEDDYETPVDPIHPTPGAESEYEIPGLKSREPIYNMAAAGEAKDMRPAGEPNYENTGYVKRLAEKYKAEIEKKNQRNSKPRR